jgi:predicted negative regulator of RcsB-dependent stress response
MTEWLIVVFLLALVALACWLLFQIYVCVRALNASYQLLNVEALWKAQQRGKELEAETEEADARAIESQKKFAREFREKYGEKPHNPVK